MPMICCSLRTTVLMIAVFSTVHFVVEAAAIFSVGEQHRLVTSSDDVVVYAMGGSFIVMTLLSCLLFVGGITGNFWICIPWLVMTFFNVAYNLFLMGSEIFKMFEAYDALKLEILALMALSTLVLLYCKAVVIMFIREMHRRSQTIAGFRALRNGKQSDEEDTYPLVEGSHEPSRVASNDYKATHSDLLSAKPSSDSRTYY